MLTYVSTTDVNTTISILWSGVILFNFIQPMHSRNKVKLTDTGAWETSLESFVVENDAQEAMSSFGTFSE